MVREYWLYDNGECPFLAYSELEDLKEDTRGYTKNIIHVIDATGMPSKEEIKAYLEYVGGLANLYWIKFGNVEPKPELVNVQKWLEQLSEE